MKDLEFLRILDFLQQRRLPWAQTFPEADKDIVWQFLHHLVASYMKGEVVTTSSLAQAGSPLSRARNFARISRPIFFG
jgi:hypothetical protein